MIKLFLFFMILIISLHSRAELLVLSNIDSHQWGITGKLENHPGSLVGQKILLTKFRRDIETESLKDLNIKVSYPQIPEDFLNSHLIYQKGKSVICNVKGDFHKFFEVVKITQYQTSFEYPSNSISEIDSILGLGNSNPNVCSVKIRLKTNSDHNKIDWTNVIQIGFEDQVLRIKERLSHIKSYNVVAKPYVDFLNQDNISFKTDDEFWFLAAASIYSEPILAESFQKLNEAYIQNWIQKLSIYVASQLNNEQYKYFLETFLNVKISSHIEEFYKIENDTEEVIYEM